MVTESDERAKAARVRAALDLIEGAQRMMNQAAVELSEVPGYADQYGRVCRLFDAIRGEWHQVEQFRPRTPATSRR